VEVTYNNRFSYLLVYRISMAVKSFMILAPGKLFSSEAAALEAVAPGLVS
jgi:hypothetical protein